MSAKQMIDKAIANVIANAEQTVSAAERHVKFLETKTEQLADVYGKLVAATEEYDIEELEEQAAQIAEQLDIEFIYVRADGRKRHYTPESFWEPSGGCSWEESAQYGYDYGWFNR